MMQNTREADSSPQKRRWKSLASLLQSLEGERVRVELKNDLEVCGVLDAVDLSDMSVVLGKASQTWLEGPRRGQKGTDMEMVMLLGSRIRFIHLPDEMDVQAELKAAHARRLKAAFKRNYIKDRKRTPPPGEALPTLGDQM